VCFYVHKICPVTANDRNDAGNEAQVKQRISHILLFVFYILLRVLPVITQDRLADSVGRLFYKLDKKHQKIMYDNLKRAFKEEYSDEKLNEIALQSIQDLVKTAFEFIRFPLYKEEDLIRMVEIEGAENMVNARREGKGVVAVSSHFGNWELLAWRIVQLGHPLTAVGREQEDGFINNLIVQMRTSKGTGHIPRGVPMFQHINELLAKNEVVGLVSDQNAGTRGVFVDFFDTTVSAFKGPALFAVRTGCKVVPVFIVREGYEKHRAFFMPAIEIQKSGDVGKDIRNYCQAYTKVIEDFVREYPTQWFWIHKRWKTRPPGESTEEMNPS